MKFLYYAKYTAYTVIWMRITCHLMHVTTFCAILTETQFCNIIKWSTLKPYRNIHTYIKVKRCGLLYTVYIRLGYMIPL